MTAPLFAATIATFLQQLRALDGLLAKAQRACTEGTITEAAIQAARIVPDMAPFPNQVNWVVVHSIGAIEACRAGDSQPVPTPPATTLDEQRTLLADAIARLSAIDPAEIDELADRPVTFSIPARGILLPFDGAGYLLSFAVPNFFFHLTTAYNLLRGLGLPIGKLDYLGQLRIKDQT